MNFLRLMLRTAFSILIFLTIIVSLFALEYVAWQMIIDFSVGRLLLTVGGFVVYCFEIAGAIKWSNYVALIIKNEIE